MRTNGALDRLAYMECAAADSASTPAGMGGALSGCGEFVEDAGEGNCEVVRPGNRRPV